MNDIRFHWMIMLRSPIDPGLSDLASMQMVRQLWGLRKLSAVIFEAEQTLSSMVGKIDLLKSTIQGGQPILPRVARQSRFLKVAAAYRNKSAYHYDVNEIKSHISGFEQTAKHRHFAHPQVGNSISELGEQVFTHPKLKELFPDSDINDFHDWCMDCSNSIMTFCNIAIAKIVEQKFPQKNLRMKSIVVGDEIAPPELRWPLFLLK